MISKTLIYISQQIELYLKYNGNRRKIKRKIENKTNL